MIIMIITYINNSNSNNHNDNHDNTHVITIITKTTRQLWPERDLALDLRSTAASSTDAVLEIVCIINGHHVGTYHRAQTLC